MYIVRDKDNEEILVEREKYIETKIKTDMIEQSLKDDNLFVDREIYENVAIEDLTDEKNH